ncbi:MAG: sugar transferase [Lachnospiraceae bacterium]|nr:sugar transferase [Lachnospiraceae bacterium]
MYQKRNQIFEIILCVIDGLVALGSLVLAGVIRYGSIARWGASDNIRLACTAVVLIHITVFSFLKVTDDFFQRGRYRELVVCLKYSVSVAVCMIFFSFVVKTDFMISRLMTLYFLCLDIPLTWLVHIAIRNRKKLFHTNEQRREDILLISDGAQIGKVIETFQRSKETMWTISGVILLDTDTALESLGNIPVVCREDDYLEFASGLVVDEVFIQISSIQKNEKTLKRMILEFEKMGLVVNLNLDLFDLGFHGEKRICSLEGYPVVSFSSRLLDYRMIVLKRVMDIVGSIIGLIITALIAIVIAPFLLHESPGPLIFRQKRVGKNGRVFEFYKFRSMYVDAEERKKELMEQNEVSGPMFKMENDPRVTKVGRFLRKTSLDEFPQFWNVLKGDMSLVGTRPPTLDEYRQYESWQRRRMSFRPGLTGLWQVSGRSDIRDFDEVVRLDLEYIDNWSLSLDVKIICKTILVILGGRGAK